MLHILVNLAISFIKNLLSVFTLLFIFIWINTSAQSPAIDSLQRLIDSENDNRNKVKYLNQLAFMYYDHDFQKTKTTAREALELAKEIDDKNGEAWSTLYLGLVSYFEGSLDEAQQQYNQVLKMNEDLKDSRIQTYLFSQIGSVSRSKGLFDSAFYFYRQAESIGHQTNDLRNYAVAKTNKARVFLIQNNPDSALIDLRIAEAIRVELNNSESIKSTWLLIGLCYLQNSNYFEAERYFNKAIAGKSTAPGLQRQYFTNMGELLFRQGKFPEALEKWRQVLQLSRQLNYRYQLSSLLLRMAEAYNEQGFYDLAAEYIHQSLEISEKASFNFLLGEAFYEYAWVYIRTRNYDLAYQNVLKAERQYKKSNHTLRLIGILNAKAEIFLGKKSYDSSLYYHLRCLSERERFGNNLVISYSLNNLGELYNLRKEYNNALPHLWRALVIKKSLNNEYGQSHSYLQLAIAHRGRRQRDSVEYYLHQAIGLSIRNSFSNILQRSYEEMASHLREERRPREAIAYLTQSIILRDSLYSQQSAQSIAGYQALYDLGSKEKEIELLNRDNLLKATIATRQKYFLIVTVIGSVFLAILLVFYYRLVVRLRVSNNFVLSKAQEIQSKSEELFEANESLNDLNTGLEKKNTELELTLQQLRLTQNQLIQAEKMASLGVLSSGIAHELNNPLNFIKGGVSTLKQQLAMRGGIETNETETYFKIINEGIDRATVILKGLGHYSHHSDRMDESCDIHDIVDNCLSILKSKVKFRVTIEKDYVNQPLIVVGNEGKLHQAFLNIIQNAEQAIEDQGTIRINTTVTLQAKTISIADTGCGIPNENLTRLGDPFFTTKGPGKGTGLGLSISYKIIKDHGGRISIKSELGKGTEIVVLFD